LLVSRLRFSRHRGRRSGRDLVGSKRGFLVAVQRRAGGRWHPGSELVDDLVEERSASEAELPSGKWDGSVEELHGNSDYDHEGDDGYSSLGIHREMIEDHMRTESFRRAIFQTCRDKVVLEVGCGTGILSVFAAQAGAKHVVAVEANEEVASYALEVVECNGLADKVSVISGRVEDVWEDVDSELRRESSEAVQADVIISEWMGFMLVCEQMFASVAFARDRWLSDGGRMLPESCTLWVAPFSNSILVEKISEYWCRRPYNVDLSPLAPHALDQHLWQPVIDTVRPQDVLANPVRIWVLRCASAGASDADEQHVEFSFEATTEGPFHGFAVWFTCELAPGIGFSTGPETPATHWEQTLLFVGTESGAHGARVALGDRLEGKLHWLCSGRSMGVVISGEVPGAPAEFARRLVLHVT